MPKKPIPQVLPNNVREFCETVVMPNYPDVDLGHCMGYFENYFRGEAGYIPHRCIELLFWDENFDKNYKNFGDCVRKARQGTPT